MYEVEGFGRERCGAGGRPGAFVPEQCLDDAP
jgi:hypothetical protein